MRSVTRLLAIAFALIWISGCSPLPTLAEPRIQIAPYLSEYKLRGKTAMDTFDPAVPSLTRNAQAELTDFGVGDHEDDFGIRGDIGNGFAGLRVDYYRMSASTSRRGTLPDGWGSLEADDLAGMSTTMDEFRVGYAHELVTAEFDAGDLENIGLRLAPGVVLAHRSMSLRAYEETKTRAQALHAADAGVVYPSLRARLSFRNFALDAEYAISPGGFDFGGDFRGLKQDFETRLSYEFEMHDVEMFVGFRRSEFEINGLEGDQNFSGDFVLDGVQVGIRVGF
ncbi:MAG: hypothetical protein Fur0037_04020 [Planctomycetota bacterium]